MLLRLLLVLILCTFSFANIVQVLSDAFPPFDWKVVKPLVSSSDQPSALCHRLLDHQPFSLLHASFLSSSVDTFSGLALFDPFKNSFFSHNNLETKLQPGLSHSCGNNPKLVPIKFSNQNHLKLLNLHYYSELLSHDLPIITQSGNIPNDFINSFSLLISEIEFIFDKINPGVQSNFQKIKNFVPNFSCSDVPKLSYHFHLNSRFDFSASLFLLSLDQLINHICLTSFDLDIFLTQIINSIKFTNCANTIIHSFLTQLSQSIKIGHSLLFELNSEPLMFNDCPLNFEILVNNFQISSDLLTPPTIISPKNSQFAVNFNIKNTGQLINCINHFEHSSINFDCRLNSLIPSINFHNHFDFSLIQLKISISPDFSNIVTRIGDVTLNLLTIYNDVHNVPVLVLGAFFGSNQIKLIGLGKSFEFSTELTSLNFHLKISSAVGGFNILVDNSLVFQHNLRHFEFLFPQNLTLKFGHPDLLLSSFFNYQSSFTDEILASNFVNFSNLQFKKLDLLFPKSNYLELVKERVSTRISKGMIVEKGQISVFPNHFLIDVISIVESTPIKLIAYGLNENFVHTTVSRKISSIHSEINFENLNGIFLIEIQNVQHIPVISLLNSSPLTTFHSNLIDDVIFLIPSLSSHHLSCPFPSFLLFPPRNIYDCSCPFGQSISRGKCKTSRVISFNHEIDFKRVDNSGFLISVDCFALQSLLQFAPFYSTLKISSESFEEIIDISLPFTSNIYNFSVNSNVSITIITRSLNEFPFSPIFSNYNYSIKPKLPNLIIFPPNNTLSSTPIKVEITSPGLQSNLIVRWSFGRNDVTLESSSEPIKLLSSSIISCRVFSDNYEPSEVLYLTYTINSFTNEPINYLYLIFITCLIILIASLVLNFLRKKIASLKVKQSQLLQSVSDNFDLQSNYVTTFSCLKCSLPGSFNCISCSDGKFPAIFCYPCFTSSHELFSNKHVFTRRAHCDLCQSKMSELRICKSCHVSQCRDCNHFSCNNHTLSTFSLCSACNTEEAVCSCQYCGLDQLCWTCDLLLHNSKLNSHHLRLVL
ncbi:hypothetical protein RCL1_005893 [Eukaryota sp. TZLM3-RCL]